MMVTACVGQAKALPAKKHSTQKINTKRKRRLRMTNPLQVIILRAIPYIIEAETAAASMVFGALHGEVQPTVTAWSYA